MEPKDCTTLRLEAAASVCRDYIADLNDIADFIQRFSQPNPQTIVVMAIEKEKVEAQ